MLLILVALGITLKIVKKTENPKNLENQEKSEIDQFQL